MTTKLLTFYILSPLCRRLLIFMLFYVIFLNLSINSTAVSIAECMKTDLDEINKEYIRELEQLNSSLEIKNSALTEQCKELLDREQLLHKQVNTLIRQKYVLQLELAEAKTNLARATDETKRISTELSSLKSRIVKDDLDPDATFEPMPRLIEMRPGGSIVPLRPGMHI